MFPIYRIFDFRWILIDPVKSRFEQRSITETLPDPIRGISYNYSPPCCQVANNKGGNSCKNSDKYLKNLIFSAPAAGWTHHKPHFRAFQTVFYIFYLKTLFLANYQWYKRFILLAKWQKLAFRRSEFLWIVRMISFVVFLCAAGAENWNTHF